jgi:hypothetical protein
MLSTIVFCEDKPASAPGRDLAEVLARTLASLVTAKVEGLLGDVRIAGPAGKSLGVVANHAGCALIEAENEANWLGLALQAARGPDVFLLRCGRAPEAGFIEEAMDFLAANSMDASLTQKSRPHPERKEAGGSIASEALREANAMEAGDWREPRSGVAKDEPSALWGALGLKDGLSGLLRMRADGGARTFETGSRSGTACLRAVPETFMERILPAAAPLAGLIAPHGLLLQAPRGGFAKLAGFVSPATAFRARARRIR